MVNTNDSSVPRNNLRLAQINCSTVITSEPVDDEKNETISILRPSEDTSVINVATPTVKPNTGLPVVESPSTPTVDAETPARNTNRFNTHHERVDPSEIREGQPIMITCVIRNLTVTNVSWIKNCVSLTHKYTLSRPWPTNRGYVFQIQTRDNRRRLLNISLSQTENGIYKCVSENPAIRDEVTITGVRGRRPIFGERTRNIRAKPPGFRAGRPNIPVTKPYNNPARDLSPPKRSRPRTPMVTIEVYMVNTNDSSVPRNNLRLSHINCSTDITSEPMDNVENETILTLSPSKDTSLINVATRTVKPNMGLLVAESPSTPRFKMTTTLETDSSDEKVITSTRTAATTAAAAATTTTISAAVATLATAIRATITTLTNNRGTIVTSLGETNATSSPNEESNQFSTSIKQSSSFLYGENALTTPSYKMSIAPETDLTDTLSSSTIFGSVSSDSMGDSTETNATHESNDGNSMKNVLTTPSTLSSKVFNTTSAVYRNSATHEAYSTIKAKTTATAILRHHSQSHSRQHRQKRFKA